MRKILVAYNNKTNGVGNRLRVSLSALNLAEFTNRKLYVVWPTMTAFRPRFSDLFEGRVGSPMSRVTSRLLAKKWPYRTNKVPDILDHSDEFVWQFRTGSNLLGPEGVRSWEENLRELRPIASIADRIVTTHQQFGGEPYLGVQVRSHPTMHDRTREASPVEWFRDRLDAVRAQYPDVRFFLSCDRPEVQAEFLERYAGSVALDDKGGYNTVLGVQSAIADAYLLAGAGYVIGPAHSSFVELAIRLANHQIQLENSLKEPMLDGTELTRVTDPLRPALRAA